MKTEEKILKITQQFLFQNSAVLKDLPTKDLSYLRNHIEDKSGKRGDYLFRQGFYPTGIYWLLSGKVKIFQQTDSGHKQTMYIYSNGDLIGYRQLLAEESHPVSAVLLEDSKISFIPADIFKSLISDSTAFARNILSTLARDFTVWTNRITVFQKFRVKERLVLALLILHEQYRLSGSPSGVITITRTELADYVGASLETIVRILNKLKTDNLLQVSGRKIVLRELNTLMNLLQKE
jgi:CRP-like cAMP-binding protein